MNSFQQSLSPSRIAVALGKGENLVLHIEGATAEELRRGLDAAQAVFEDAGITAEKALWAIWQIESNDDVGLPNPIPAEALEHFHVWDIAERAAIEACCAGWQTGNPSNSVLHIFPDLEPAIS